MAGEKRNETETYENDAFEEFKNDLNDSRHSTVETKKLLDEKLKQVQAENELIEMQREAAEAVSRKNITRTNSENHAAIAKAKQDEQTTAEEKAHTEASFKAAVDSRSETLETENKALHQVIISVQEEVRIVHS